MTPSILCFADHEKALVELVAGARKAAGPEGKVHAAGIGIKGDTVIQAGADVAQIVDAADLNPETLAKGVLTLAKEANASAVILSASKRGRAFAGLVAQSWDAAYAAEVSDLRIEDGTPVATRMLLSGNTNGTLRYEAERIVVTANHKTWEAAAPDAGRQGETRQVRFEAASKVQLVAVHPHEAATLNLSAAKIVVGAGRGIKKKDDLKLINDLAAALGGAVGCSRPIAADLKWLGEEHWIGLSGNEIKPRLYVACGISGQIQHMTGCRGSKTIVAINTDEDAPIFENADYGIVGDVYDVLPKLTEVIRTKYK